MTLKEFYAAARKVKWAIVTSPTTGERIVRTARPVKASDVTGSSLDREHLCPLAYVFRSWGTMNTPLDENREYEEDYLGVKIAERADGDQGWRGRYRLMRRLAGAK